MPLFSNPFDVDIEKATSEMNTSEDWAVMLDICDKAKQSQTAAKNCLRSIMKRVFNRNPHVALQALSLLNACVKNSSRTFHLEVASRDFVADCRKVISEENNNSALKKVSTQLKLHLKNWSENEFKSDSALSIVPDLYKSLKEEGISFSNDEQPKSKRFSKDPNVVQSQEEEEDIAKAIALSLRESERIKPSPLPFNSSTSSSIYPSMSGQVAHSNTSTKNKEPKKVRTLYDFEAVEDNELTFKAGEIIGVIDDSDQNWWKGVSWRGEGLFPANFVTSNLDDPVEEEKPDSSDDNKYTNTEEEKVEVVYVNKIDEEKIDQTLNMLQNADPTGEMSSDPENMVQYEERCRKMLPLIDQELEKIDREHSKLMEINGKLIFSLELYHKLMAELPSATKIPTNMPIYQQQLEQQMMMMQLQQQALSIPQLHQQQIPVIQPGLQQQMPIPQQHQQQQIPASQYQQVQNSQIPGISGTQFHQVHNMHEPVTQVVGQQQHMTQSFQQNIPQQPIYSHPYYNSLSSFTEMYLGNGGHRVSINSIPVMTAAHMTMDETNSSSAPTQLPAQQ